MSKYNINNLERFKINPSEITQQIKPVNFTDEIFDNMAKYKNDLIENLIKELIKPYLDAKYYSFNPYELEQVVKSLDNQGYKIGCLEDEYYSTYYIENKITKEMDYFLAKNKTEIEQEENKYTATNYISEIVRNIK